MPTSFHKVSQNTMRAAERALPSDIEELRTIHGQMCGRAEAGDCMGYPRADFRWHERLWRIADNE